MPSFRESVLEQYGRDYACLECVLEFPTEYKAVAHFSYVHNAVEESGRLPHRFGIFHIVDILFHSSSFRYHIVEERQVQEDDQKDQSQRQYGRKPAKAKRGRSKSSKDPFECALCAFVPESKTLKSMYSHYVTCLPDFIRHLHAFFPTFLYPAQDLLYPAQDLFHCPLCDNVFSERRRLEEHLGVDHKRVEAYLSKAKIITEEMMAESAFESVAEEKQVEKVQDDNHELVKEINTVESETRTAASTNTEKQNDGQTETDKSCSQIFLETADDSSEDSDADEHEQVPLEKSEEYERGTIEMEGDLIEVTENFSNDESDEAESDFEDSAVIEIEANIPDEMLIEKDEAVKKVQNVEEVFETAKSSLQGSKGKTNTVDKMRRKRKAMKLKNRKETSRKSVKYCVCQRPYQRSDGPMVACDGGCSQWFHFSCLGFLPHHTLPPGPWNCEACQSKG